MTDLDLARRDADSSDFPAVARPRPWTAHPVATVFVVALALRLAVSVLLLASGHWPVQPDERQYIALAHTVASGQPASAWDEAWGHDLFVQAASYLVPLVALFKLFGTHVFLGMLLSGAAGAGAAALTTRLAMETRPTSLALPAGLGVALLPSQILWSSLVLREAPAWAALACLALLLAVAFRTTSLTRLAALSVAVAADLFALFHLRPYVFVVAAWAMLIAALLAPAVRRFPVNIGAAALAVVLPALVGIGPAGLTLVSSNVPALARIQAHLAVGADSAIVEPKPAPASTTAGSASRPVDDSGNSAPAGARSVLRGVAGTTLRPLPWERPSGGGALLALVENLIWLPIYALAFVGAWARRRDRRTLVFPFVFSCGFIVMSALFEGNVGTAFRHRGQIAWAVILLAACGFQFFTARRGRDSGVAAEPIS